MRPDGTVQEWTEISEPRPTLRKVFLNCNFSPAWNIYFIKARYYKCPISKNSICSDINLKESERTSLIYEIYLQCHPRLMGNDNYLSPTRPSLISFSGPFFSLNYPHLCACHHNCRPIWQYHYRSPKWEICSKIHVLCLRTCRTHTDQCI